MSFASSDTGLSRGAPEPGLLSNVKAGDVAAFVALYDRYGDRAYRVAWSMLGDQEQAEAAVADGFLALWRNREDPQPRPGSDAAWVLREVLDQAIDQAERAAARVGPSDGSAAQGGGAEPSDPLPSLLAKLPAFQREIITLAYYGNLTHTEIASILGLPSATVKGRMRLGLERLKAEIDVPSLAPAVAPPTPDPTQPAPRDRTYERLDRRGRLLRAVQRALLSDRLRGTRT